MMISQIYIIAYETTPKLNSLNNPVIRLTDFVEKKWKGHREDSSSLHQSVWSQKIDHYDSFLTCIYGQTWVTEDQYWLGQVAGAPTCHLCRWRALLISYMSIEGSLIPSKLMGSCKVFYTLYQSSHRPVQIEEGETQLPHLIGAVLFCSGCQNKSPQVGWLSNNRSLFLTVLQPRKSKLKARQILS